MLKFQIFFLVSFLLNLTPIIGSQKPNIIIFMADDMGIGDTSAYLEINLMEGTKPISKTVKTPHIEKFAKEGMIFTDAMHQHQCAVPPVFSPDGSACPSLLSQKTRVASSRPKSSNDSKSPYNSTRNAPE